MRGNSFAMGPSHANGPVGFDSRAQKNQGWIIPRTTCWDFMEPSLVKDMM